MTLDSAGNVVGYRDYYPFGETMPERSEVTAGPDTRYQFTSKELDTKTSLYYFGARYYDSWRGQWLSVDPLAKKYPGWSSYDYVRDNPATSIDPNGAQVKPKQWVNIAVPSPLPPLQPANQSGAGSVGNSASASSGMPVSAMRKIQRLGAVVGTFELVGKTAEYAGKASQATEAGQVLQEVTAPADVLSPVAGTISVFATLTNNRLNLGMKAIMLANEALAYAGPEGLALSFANDIIAEQNAADLEYARTHFTIGSEATGVSTANPK